MPFQFEVLLTLVWSSLFWPLLALKKLFHLYPAEHTRTQASSQVSSE